MAGIDEIMDRLRNGDTLMIDDQLRSYINIESDDMPSRVVMRSIYANIEDAWIAIDKQCPAKYEEKRFGSLTEALLSLTDYEWRGIGQGPSKEINGCKDCHQAPCVCDDWQADEVARREAENEQ